MTTADFAALRFVLAGSVGSSRRTFEGLLRHRANVVGVLGLSRDASQNVSGYARLDDLATGAGVEYEDFRGINDETTVETVRRWAPDLFFVVGLSQLVKDDLLKLPRLGCVGFHPTQLPQGRGRAPLAWLTMDAEPGAATFFLMDEGVDSGAILAQETYAVSEHDYASDVVEKMDAAIDAALDRWLPGLLAGRWEPQPQDDRQATYNGRRSPADGLIDWRRPAREILALIRATSRPHPGAYSYYKRNRLIVWRAAVARDIPFRGVPGRVLLADDERGHLVQTGEGLLWLTEIESAEEGGATDAIRLGVGQKLGYSAEDEVHRLSQRIAVLEQRIEALSQQLPSDRNE